MLKMLKMVDIDGRGGVSGIQPTYLILSYQITSHRILSATADTLDDGARATAPP